MPTRRVIPIAASRASWSHDSVKLTLGSAFAVATLASASWAQHSEHQHAPEPKGPTLFQSDMALMAGMTPRDPMADMKMAGWSWMVMGVARIVFNDQGGPSGATVGESTNWNMVMGHHDLGPGRLTLMMMNSLEPATLHDDGSPQLFQTGEAFQGRPLVDRQHAHDFFMNLSATWRWPFGAEAAVWIQAAPVGDPALGPTAFMHRASSGENPASPLGHHWQDSTHVTSSVVTLGGGWGSWALEGSGFHGEEPDEHRWGIDGGGLDSYSGRLAYRGRGPWSAQVSYGRLEDPEQLEPGDLKRTTASIHYRARGDGPIAASLIWGRNDEEHGVSDGLLLEGAYAVTGRDQVFARTEYVEKNQTLLATKALPPEGEPVDLAAIRALTLGYLRDLPYVGIGGDITVYDYPSGLEGAYGEHPLAAHVFLRFRWSLGSHGGTH